MIEWTRTTRECEEIGRRENPLQWLYMGLELLKSIPHIAPKIYPYTSGAANSKAILIWGKTASGPFGALLLDPARYPSPSFCYSNVSIEILMIWAGTQGALLDSKGRNNWCLTECHRRRKQGLAIGRKPKRGPAVKKQTVNARLMCIGITSMLPIGYQSRQIQPYGAKKSPPAYLWRTLPFRPSTLTCAHSRCTAQV